MNDTDLRELFEEILGEDPTYEMPVDDDVARGRSLRARLRHRRATAGTLVATSAVAFGVIFLPWPTDGPPPDTDGSAGRAATADDRQDETQAARENEVTADMWEAIEQTLPEDVHVAEGEIVNSGETPELFVTLERDNVEFDLAVWLQSAQPGLDRLGLCESERSYVLCDEGMDATGRWRVVASGSEGDGLAVLEDGQSSVTLRWEPDTIAASGTTVLSGDEIDALTDALLEVGSQHAKSELISGVDLAAIDGGWPEVRAQVEDALGMGRIRTESPVDVVIDDETTQTGSASVNLVTPAGTRVQMTLRQALRPHELCRESACGQLASDARTGDGTNVDISRTSSSVEAMTWVGQRAMLEIKIRPADNAPRDADLTDAARAIAEAFPRLSPSR